MGLATGQPGKALLIEQIEGNVMSRFTWVLVAIAALVLFFGSTIIRLYTDSLWFADLGYSVVFSTLLWTRLFMTLVFAALFFVIVYTNLWIAKRLAPPPTRRYSGVEDELRQRFSTLARRGLTLLLLVGTIVVSLIFGLQAASHADEWLRFANATPFGVNDPIFNRDIGFYVFRLPFLSYLYGWVFFAVLVAGIAAALLHYANEGIDFIGNSPRFSSGVKTHLAVLLAILFFLKAFGYWLARFNLVNTPGTLFYGAGYTDATTRVFAYSVLIIAAVIGGLLVLLNAYRRGIWLAAGALAGLLGVSILVGAVYPSLVEQISVKPNQLAKQTPYIRHALNATRMAFGVDQITSRAFDYEDDLTAQQIANNQAAVQNLRLWNYEPLKRVYNQLQVFQQYYEFADVDIDRYTIDGTYRQVMLSARELAGLPERSQTWVNQHLRYTHGYAYVMSPVNIVAGEGLPVYYVDGIPPNVRGGLDLDVPQVYFGERTEGHVFVDTRQKEFDYPVGGEDRENTYDADSGPLVGSFFRKLAFAARLSDFNMVLSNDIRTNSRVLFRRNIVERAQALFPFLALDNDPYLVTVNGRLFWFHDAYTITDRYPYSEPVGLGFHNRDAEVNYIRNSVKIVTDAYTGKVEAFVTSPDDPIIKTYQRIFPGILKPMDQMPEEYRAHIRYPKNLFEAQAHVYAKYHVTDASTFYSGTDLWQLPSITTNDDGSDAGRVQPYYVITRLPDSTRDEFILIIPMRRANRENMVAWMAARCDSPSYGQLIVYKFPSGERVYGPSQIKGRVDQDTEISQQLTLWGQLGSSVVRGDLLAIPIEKSVLYIEPLYLESTTTQIPEFKRVIVALGDRIAMEETLEQALAKVVGADALPTVAAAGRITDGAAPPTRPETAEQPARPQPTPAPPVGGTPALTEVRELAQRARDQYRRAQELQRKGDWAGYGREITALEKTLAELERRTE